MNLEEFTLLPIGNSMRKVIGLYRASSVLTRWLLCDGRRCGEKRTREVT
jgi:hypothetical protein